MSGVSVNHDDEAEGEAFWETKKRARENRARFFCYLPERLNSVTE